MRRECLASVASLLVNRVFSCLWFLVPFVSLCCLCVSVCAHTSWLYEAPHLFCFAAPRSQGLTQDRTANKRSPTRGDVALAQGPRTTSATSSPDHSDHALSVSSDSGLSSTSLWADKPTPVASATTTTTSVKANQGPSQQEKVQLKRLLSGFGLEDPSLEEMTDEGARMGVQQVVPAQVHINGDPQTRERETDILDDEVITGHDLHSVDSLGTLSSSCHKSSQNSLLSDGFGSPGGEEQQSQSQHHIHHVAPHPIEDYERSYAEARRGCLSYRSNSIASSNPSNAPVPQQHVYRQGSYSTQSWVRQQQMVAAQHFTYMPEDGNDADRFHRNKQGGSLPKAGLPAEPQGLTRDSAADLIRNVAPHKEQTSINNNNNNKRDEEFKSLTKDIDNSIDQLNQLIMDLDPTFVPSHGSSIKRKGGTPVNGSVGKCSNGINLRFSDNNSADLKSTQQTGKIVSLGVVVVVMVLMWCCPGKKRVTNHRQEVVCLDTANKHRKKNISSKTYFIPSCFSPAPSAFLPLHSRANITKHTFSPLPTWRVLAAEIAGLLPSFQMFSDIFRGKSAVLTCF